jgi:hypothetical protein
MKDKPPREVSEIRKRKPRPKPKSTLSRWKWDWKYWLALALSLLLGAIGLQARPTISLEPPLDVSNVLTTRVIIANDGLLALTNVRVAEFDEDILFADYSRSLKSLGERYVPPAGRLEPGEKERVSFQSLVVNLHFPIVTADIGLIVSFSPQYLPFLNRRKAFRFKTVADHEGRLRLEEQPAGDLMRDYEKSIKWADQRYRDIGMEPPTH